MTIDLDRVEVDNGYYKELGISEDSYDALNDLILSTDNFDRSIYSDQNLYIWVESILYRDCELTSEDVLELSANIGKIIINNYKEAKRNGEEIHNLSDVIEYMELKYPIEWLYVRNKINYLDNLCIV